MKVYIVEYQRWDEHYICGVFTTRELAQKHIDDADIVSGYYGHKRLNYTIIEEELIGEDGCTFI